MIRVLLLLMGIFMAGLCFSQQNYLRLRNDALEKEKIIQDQSRVRINTIYGKKISGIFYIVDKEHILIKNMLVPLDKILMIKRNPLALNIAIDAVLVYTSMVLLGAGLLVAFISEYVYFAYFALPAVGLIYAAIKSPNFLKAHKRIHSWQFEIVQGGVEP